MTEENLLYLGSLLGPKTTQNTIDMPNRPQNNLEFPKGIR